LLLSTG